MAQDRPLIFGEVLFDCFPDDREVLGGAPFNVAWNLQAFGQQPIFISRVGNDRRGRQIQEAMTCWSMDTAYLQQDNTKPTGRVEISLTEGEPSFAILDDQAYDHISSDMPRLHETPSFLYHGSLALRNDASRKALAAIKQDYRCPIFVDVNLRNPWWDTKSVHAMISDAAWLKLNEDEYKTLFPEEGEPENCGNILFDRYNLKAVFLTMGSRGAMAFTRDSVPLTVKPTSSTEVLDTVGAGDAFSSVLLLGLVHQWPLEDTLDRAQEFASAVVGQRGATTGNRAFYQTLLNRWPAA